MNSISLSFAAFPKEKAGVNDSLRLRSPEETPIKDISRTDFSDATEEKLPTLRCADGPIQESIGSEIGAQFSVTPAERKSGTLFYSHGNKGCPQPNLYLVLLRGPPECHRRIPLYVPFSSSSSELLPSNATADPRVNGLVVGRSTTCDVVLDPWVVFASSRHAILSSQLLSSLLLPSGASGIPDAIFDKEKKSPKYKKGEGEGAESCEKSENDTFWVTDLGSTNGTFVNKNRLAAMVPHALHHGDTIIFGGMQDVDGLLDSVAMQRSELVVWRVETPAGAEDERLLFSSVEDDVRVGSVVLDSVLEAKNSPWMQDKIPEENEEDELYEPTTLPIRPSEHDLDRYASFLLEEAIDSTHTSWCERKEEHTVPKALHRKPSTDEGPQDEDHQEVARNEMDLLFQSRLPSPVVRETTSEVQPKTVSRVGAAATRALSSERNASTQRFHISIQDGGEVMRKSPSRRETVHVAFPYRKEVSPSHSPGRCTSLSSVRSSDKAERSASTPQQKKEGEVSSLASQCTSSTMAYSPPGSIAAPFTPPLPPPPLTSNSGTSFTPQDTLAVTRYPHGESQEVRSVLLPLERAETPSAPEEATAFLCPNNAKEDRVNGNDTSTDEEDSLEGRDCGPITQLPHLFPLSWSSLEHSPLPPLIATPSRRSKRGSGLQRAKEKKSGEKSASTGTIVASSSAPLLSSCPSVPSAVSGASTVPLSFHFTHARLGSWRFTVPTSCCSSQPFVRKDEKKECTDEFPEAMPQEYHRHHGTKMVAASGEKPSPLSKRKRQRNEEVPVESVEGGERHLETTTTKSLESASDSSVFSLSFTPVHWVWGMNPTAVQVTHTEAVRCVLPITSIATVLVCPALCGLAVELAAHVKQLPCSVPSSVLDPPEGAQEEREALWQKQNFSGSVKERESVHRSGRTTSIAVSSFHLHRWIVWYFAPERKALTDPPPEGLEKECSSAPSPVDRRDPLGNHGNPSSVPHERRATGRKDKKKDTSSSLKSVEKETPLLRGGTAQNTMNYAIFDNTSFFREWVCSLFHFYHKLGLPEPLCVDSTTFLFLVKE